jgi:N-acetylmuramic acid 6-phosphate etherase
MVENVLITEAGGDPSAGYESKPTLDLVELMNTVDATVPSAVAAVAPAIAEAVDATAARLRAGGRLVYVGAGSSGRIAALDASECEATFSTPPGMVVALVAGGESAPALVQAAAEDDREAGTADVEALDVDTADAVVGVSASGSTPYVLGALAAATRAGALTGCVVCAPQSELGGLVAHEIAVVVGPEFVAGSTRLKAGTAQKLVLNTISTISMIRLGKTYGNLMVDVVAANKKLQDRVRRIVAVASGASATEVDDAIADADGDARVAIVMLLARVDAQEARRRLDGSGRSIADALEATS